MASNAVCLLKRVPTGLRFGPEDFGLQLKQAANGIVRALGSISAPPPVKLLEIIGDTNTNTHTQVSPRVKLQNALR
eukprot:3737456-Pleurochrysis_carterae.AAC.1